ncbi:MAG: hypothetical protein V1750_02435 [Acidobacteriota bacterium]
MRRSITRQVTVGALLREVPEAASVFLRRQMACVGCAIAELDTLADAAAAYCLSVTSLLAEVEQQAATRAARRPSGAPRPGPAALGPITPRK